MARGQCEENAKQCAQEGEYPRLAGFGGGILRIASIGSDHSRRGIAYRRIPLPRRTEELPPSDRGTDHLCQIDIQSDFGVIPEAMRYSERRPGDPRRGR